MRDSQGIIDRFSKLDANIVMFADGFVDEVWEIVNARSSITDFTVYNRMNQFAERITNSGSGGIGLELVQKRRAFGGFTANIGFAAGKLGVGTTMIGVYGKDKTDQVFNEVAESCHVISLGDPAVTHVFEFDDGKILMSNMGAVQNISWRLIVDTLGIGKVKALMAESDIIGVGYWSLLPAFDEIVSGVCGNLPLDGRKRRFFFDFADFLKRDQTSLKSTLQLLKELNGKIPMTLSVNEHEAAALFAMYDETMDESGRPIEDKTEYIRQQIGFDELVIHTPHFASAASANEKAALVKQHFCVKPVRSAGAGDTFNGGYIAASLAGLSIPERLYAANSAVSYFLNNGAFPDRKNLFDQMSLFED